MTKNNRSTHLTHIALLRWNKTPTYVYDFIILLYKAVISLRSEYIQKQIIGVLKHYILGIVTVLWQKFNYLIIYPAA